MHKKVKKINTKIKIDTKKLVLAIAIVLLIIDVILNIIYIGYKSNIVSIAVIAYVLIKYKKKNTLIPMLLIAVSLLFVVYNFTSKKYHNFKIDDKKVKIQVPTMSKLKSLKNDKYLITSVDLNNVEITSYFDKFEQLSCNSNYYYDEKEDVTIEGFNNIIDDNISINLYSGNQCDNIKNNIKHETYNKFINIENVLSTDVEELIEYGYTVISNENYNTNKYLEFNKSDYSFIRIISIVNDEFIVSDITKKDGYYLIDSVYKQGTNKTSTYMRFSSIEEINGVLYASNGTASQKIANSF